jgi:hypothetical protein
MTYSVDVLLKTMWEYMGLIRVYTKRRGQAPDLEEPIILSAEREGLTVGMLHYSLLVSAYG